MGTKTKREGGSLVGIVAQWQITGGLSQRPRGSTSGGATILACPVIASPSQKSTNSEHKGVLPIRLPLL